MHDKHAPEQAANAVTCFSGPSTGAAWRPLNRGRRAVVAPDLWRFGLARHPDIVARMRGGKSRYGSRSAAAMRACEAASGEIAAGGRTCTTDA